MKKINVVQLIASILLLIWSVLNLIDLFVEIGLVLNVVGWVCLLGSIVCHIILLVQMRKQRKS